MIATDIETVTKFERAVVARLLADDDPPEIAKHMGCSLPVASELRDRLPITEER